jgi:tetratricopeptide (TPR) repeat protein
VSEARKTYEKLAPIDALGASFAASGLGDLAAFEGRFSEAVGILERGAAQDVAAMNSDSAAAKFAAVAYAELSRGRSRERAAIDAAEQALRHSTAVKIRFLAARTFVNGGDIAKARPHIDSLANELYAEARAHAKILEGLIALRDGDARQAMILLREANDLFDTWIGFFDLGRASLAAGAFSAADSAFEVCLNTRRGEALSLFVDEEPTYAYLPQVYYYQGLVREGLKNANGAAESFRNYITIRGNSKEDPLLPEVRKRVGG